MIKTYREVSRLKTFEERFEYLRLDGVVGVSTFGHDRYLNQALYKSRRWRRLRDEIIIRDGGCDLGIAGREIFDRIIVHHMNPLLIKDVLHDLDLIYEPEYLICTTFTTHNAIHYGDESQLIRLPKERTPGDTILW
ncbi:MAG: hypothetical protein GX807_03855 [Erysipelotrichia bacterium]|nr:hypothetical protein [Erysipelotrichia bacterium]